MGTKGISAIEASKGVVSTAKTANTAVGTGPKPADITAVATVLTAGKPVIEAAVGKKNDRRMRVVDEADKDTDGDANEIIEIDLDQSVKCHEGKSHEEELGQCNECYT